MSISPVRLPKDAPQRVTPQSVPSRSVTSRSVASHSVAVEAGFRDLNLPARAFIVDLLSLTKPRIMFLLLISTACPMVLAAGGSPDLQLLLYALVGGAMISGSASVINCIWDRDIDRVMERTKNRAIAAGRISSTTAAVFSVVIGFAGLLVLAVLVNPLAATIALFGHFFYVFVYTMWLKRTTPQNIVIGGAAGAVPPVVGWVAVTGSINLTAILMFLIIFLWTPPHFWALALNKNDDYRRAGIPMLPVVAGEKITHLQMLCYALALIPVSVLMVVSDSRLGWFSMVAFLSLGLVFAYKTYELKQLGDQGPEDRFKEDKIKKAWDVFGFSLIYLSLFFVCLVVDSIFL